MSTQTTILPRIALAPGRPAVKVREHAAAGAVQVLPVQSRRDMSQFIELPKRIYRGDRHWVAPLDMQTRQFLNRKTHPFYQHGDAAAFLAKRDGQTVGRILVSDDSRYNRAHGTNVGCFGLFESIDDPRTCRSLLDTGARWLAARGRTELLGPIDYSTNYPTGLLVDGFSSPPSVMMNHHPEYYQELLAGCGLTKAKDLYAWWFDGQNNMDSKWEQRVQRLAQRYRVRVRPISFRNFNAEVARCKAIYNQSLEANWGFVKMTSDEFDHLAYELKQMAVPELMQIAEVNGQPVGLSIALPNLNEAIQPLRGSLMTLGLPIGLLRLVYRLKRVQTGRLAVLGVVPGYRRRGVAEALIQQTFRNTFEHRGYRGVELGWTLEDNTLVNRMIERVGGRHYKTYRIFQKQLRGV